MRLAMALFLFLYGIATQGADWRTASHEPVGLAPDPASPREAVVQMADRSRRARTSP